MYLIEKFICPFQWSTGLGILSRVQAGVSDSNSA